MENFLEVRAQARQADIVSFDEATRTAEMQFAIGARVRRFDWMIGDYLEEVSMEQSAADLTRVAKGVVPFLKNHGSIYGATIEDVMGNIFEASVDGKSGAAKVRFSSRADVAPFIQDIKDGILKSVSMGYWPRTMEKVAEQDGIPVFRVTKWELGEISSVAMPADADASFRSAEKVNRDDKSRLIRCEIRGFEIKSKQNQEPNAKINVESQRALTQDQITGDISMTEQELAAKREAEVKAAELAAKEAGKKAERERQAEIRKAVRAAGFEESFAEELINGDKSADQARSAVIEKLAATDKSQNTRSIRVEAGDLDATKTRREAMKEAILHRGLPEKFKLTEMGRNWAGLTLLEMARESLRLQGVSVGHMSRTELASRSMHSTSDFPEITADIINKSLRDSFLAAPQTFEPITKRVQNPDFKQISRVQLGLGSSLSEIGEGGEITYGTVGEAAEKYAIKEYAKGLSISRKTIINDDLEAFVRIPSQMGQKAKSLESDLIYAVLTANANMADGNALFSAAHGNLTTGPGTVINIANLGIGRAKVRAQTEMDGEKLNLPVNFLIVPVALETLAEQYISAVQANVQSSNNPFAQGGRTPLSLIVEPRLDANSAVSWYLASMKSMVDMLELATLSGTTEPEVLMEEGFDVLGMKFRVVHSVGVKAIDWRGLYKNVGV